MCLWIVFRLQISLDDIELKLKVLDKTNETVRDQIFCLGLPLKTNGTILKFTVDKIRKAMLFAIFKRDIKSSWKEY